MHVDGLESDAVECCRHLDLAVDALLAQNRNSRPRGIYEWRRDIGSRIERQVRRDAGISGIEDAVVFLLRALRIIALPLHVESCFGPRAVQFHPGCGEKRRAIRGNREFAGGLHATDAAACGSQPCLGQYLQHLRAVGAPHLNYGAKFLVEKLRGRRRPDLEFDAAAARKHHFAYRDEQTAVGAVVISEYQVCGIELLDCAEERAQQACIVGIGCRIAGLTVHLGQRRTAHPALVQPQIDQNQIGFAAIGAQLWRQSFARIGHVRKCRHDQRQGRRDLFFFRAVAPRSLHRHRVLADRNADAELRAKLEAHGAHRVVERRVFAGVTGGRHPVCRKLDVADAGDRRRGDIGDRLTDRHPG